MTVPVPDDYCEATVTLGDVTFRCDRLLGHDGYHGGVYPGDVGGSADVDVSVLWENAA